MRMTNKAWQKETATTIKNCFAHCGFSSSIIEEEVKDISLQPPEEWDTVAPEICLEDFITCDGRVMTAGILSDEEILDSVSESNERDGYETEDPNNITCTQLVSIREARIAFNTLRNFIEQTSKSEEKEFSALCILDNARDKEQPHLKQKKNYWFLSISFLNKFIDYLCNLNLYLYVFDFLLTVRVLPNSKQVTA